jgi:hypothetical protein
MVGFNGKKLNYLQPKSVYECNLNTGMCKQLVLRRVLVDGVRIFPTKTKILPKADQNPNQKVALTPQVQPRPGSSFFCTYICMSHDDVKRGAFTEIWFMSHHVN